MSKKYTSLGCLLGLSAALTMGCQDRSSDLVSVEANSIGVTQVEIHHGIENGERVLTVRGLDDSEQELAHATLRTGRVLYSFDPELFAPAWNDGTELAAAMGDETFSIITPDREPHETQAPDQADLASFVRLRAVAGAIEDEAGIRFPSLTTDGEVALSAGACDGSQFPTGKGNPIQCCKDGNTSYHKIAAVSANGVNQNLLGTRAYGAACTTSSGGPVCGNPGSPQGTCNFGACGGTGGGATGNASAVVFHPVGQTTVCGRDTNGTGTGGGTPENYTGSQTLWTGVTATCPYVSCCYQPNAGISVQETTATCTMIDGESCSADSQCQSSFCMGFAGNTCSSYSVVGFYQTEITSYSGDLNERGNISVGPLYQGERIDIQMYGDLNDMSVTGGCVGCAFANTISAWAGTSSGVTITHNPSGASTTISFY